ncbi:MAG: hypothetical protein DHS20C13_21360 [Thermodesulfobacteriota bacterium]|nr:MAG: hypothetical protein DHS20C13_21360 [Thermodesulfobacteriota bacterium]
MVGMEKTMAAKRVIKVKVDNTKAMETMATITNTKANIMVAMAITTSMVTKIRGTINTIADMDINMGDITIKTEVMDTVDTIDRITDHMVITDLTHMDMGHMPTTHNPIIHMYHLHSI